MSYSKAFKELKFDVRMKEYNLGAGIVTQDELKAYKEGLEDSSANAEALEIEIEQTPQEIPQDIAIGTAADFGGLSGFGGGFGGNDGQGGGFTF